MISRALTVLHVDDKDFEHDSVMAALAEPGEFRFRVVGARSVEECAAELKRIVPDVAIVDINLSAKGGEGMGLITTIRKACPDVVVVMRSTLDDARTVQRSVALGADDFLSKKVSDGELVHRIVNAYTLTWIKRGGLALTFPHPHSVALVGQTMQAISQRIARLIPSAVAAVHVTGESGTGKELVADLIEAHAKGVPFLRVNCGAIAPSLLESELFGHAKGAFTGAAADRKGFVEQASGGWLFLDEVASLSPSAQVALLRVLENKEVLRLGEGKPRKVHVRILSACHESLERLVAEGRFRRDLWQRLREDEIFLPPLRERPGEIPALVAHFCAAMDGGPYSVTPEALEVLAAYPWKDGNVRELRNCLRSMTTLQVNKSLALASVPARVWETISRENESPTVNIAPTSSPEGVVSLAVPRKLGPREPVSFDALVDELFLSLLRKIVASGNPRLSLRTVSQALLISPSTVHRKFQSLISEGKLAPEELGHFG